MTLIIHLIIWGCCLIYGYFIVKKKLSYWEDKGVPYIKLISLGLFKNPLTYVTEAYMKFKSQRSTFGGIFIALTPAVIVSDLDLLANILVKDFRNFENRFVYSSQKGDVTAGGLAFRIGNQWKIQRRNAGPLFTPKNLKMLHLKAVDSSTKIHKHMVTTGQMDGVINVGDVAEKYIIETCGNILFGSTINVVRQRTPFKQLLFKFNKTLFQFVLFGIFSIFYPNVCKIIKLKAINAKNAELFTTIINTGLEEKMKSGKNENDLGELFLKSQKAGILTSVEIMGLILTLLGGELVLIKNTLVYAIYELALNQEIQDRAREEIRECIEKYDGKCTYEACAEMKYVDQIIKETLRKYPIVPTTSRICNEDYEVGDTGLVIKKGTPIIIPFYGIHHDPEIYPDPEKFDPERFTKEAIQARHRYAYLPFGGGLRSCIGSRYAMMQMRVDLVNFLMNYRIYISPKTPPQVKFDPKKIFLIQKGIMWLKFEKIE